MTNSEQQQVELLDVRGDVLIRGDQRLLATLVAGPARDRYWIREANGETLTARAWERKYAHPA